MSEKRRWPRAAAIAVARELCRELEPVTERLIVAGSLRRRKPFVGDVEILYVPKVETRPLDLLYSEPHNLVDEVLVRLIAIRRLAQRTNIFGHPNWGTKNKHALHRTLIPVDLFAATTENWFNYLVCRTGPAESNTRIATEAQRRGWKWHPYGSGFETPNGLRRVESERDVFEFLGLEYLEPWER